MSAVTSRPQVTRIIIDAAEASFITAASLAVEVLRAAAPRVLAACRGHDVICSKRPSALTPPGNVSQPLPSRAQSLNAADGIRLETLMSLGNLVVRDVSTLTSALQSLAAAPTYRHALVAREAVLTAARQGHQGATIDRLIAASTNASRALGFVNIKPRLTAPDRVSVIAKNEKGQALVTEIEVPLHRSPSMSTEVFGVFDNSCSNILDQFDEALSGAGVRSESIHRSLTGGICELAATREFLKRRLVPQPLTSEKKAKDTVRRRLSSVPARQRRGS